MSLRKLRWPAIFLTIVLASYLTNAAIMRGSKPPGPDPKPAPAQPWKHEVKLTELDDERVVVELRLAEKPSYVLEFGVSLLVRSQEEHPKTEAYLEMEVLEENGSFTATAVMSKDWVERASLDIETMEYHGHQGARNHGSKSISLGAELKKFSTPQP